MAKQPKIRFKGFTEEWKEKKISDLLSERIDMAPQSDAYPLMAFVANKGIVSKGDRYDRSALIKDAVNKPYKRTSYGDFIYSSNNLEAGSIGMNFYGNASISPVYSIFAPKGDNNPYYLGVRLAMPDVIHEMVRCRQGVVYGQWKIHEDEFLNISVKMPKPDEQKAISQVIIDLTTTITSREAELEKLKNVKRALLGKLFPQDGQSIPAIRFKGFNEKWIDVPFGKLIIENKEVSTVENEDTLLSSAIEGMFLNSELFGHQRGQSNIGYRKITKGMLILSAQNLHLGNANVNLRFDHGIVSPAYKTYNIQGADTEFMAVWVKREETKAFFDKATTAGASKCRKNIDWDDLYQQNLAMPLDDEQKKIGKFILTLDRLITLREKYIKQLKHSKQALLEQMFVNN